MRDWRIWAGLTLALALMALTTAAAFALTPVGPTATCAGREATIVGSAGADALSGTAGPDVIAGRGGPDRIAGGSGSDRCLGGLGSNALVGCELPARRAPVPASGPAASPVPSGNDALPAGPGIPIDPDPPIPPTQIASTPPLIPAFDPAVSDYAVRCDGTPLALAVTTAPGDTVAVDGEVGQGGSFETEVPLEPEQGFGFAVEADGQARDFHVRCLPSDFPSWEYERLRQPSHGFYMAAPTLLIGETPPPYVVVFDDEGVPLWWHEDNPGPIDAKFLGPDRVAWWTQDETSDGYEIRELDGDVTHTVSFVGNPPTSTSCSRSRTATTW